MAGVRRDRDDELASFGSYRVLRRIGRGGMGSIWLAERTTPPAGVCALKVMDAPGAGDEAVWRFAGERQALARMSHPNIATIQDVGTTPCGRLYLAMDFVDGPPVTEYADRQQLTIAQRLELFVPICDAVQHAHQRGVIHRDLKPSNILVEQRERRATPVVIDFGIAKPTAMPDADHTSWAQRSRVLGTPEYMSPEQIQDPAGGVDGRADVYSLGAVLYELLTGTVPWQHHDLGTVEHAELRRLVQRRRIPVPSARIGDHPRTERTRAAAAARATSVDSLIELLDGNLDGIVSRAIADHRGRRYETPRALGEDLRRHLRGEPATAPPRAGWRWLRRTAR